MEHSDHETEATWNGQQTGAQEARSTIILMERGTTWPTWLGNPMSGQESSAVHAQMHDESHRAFANRVVPRIAEGVAPGSLQVAVLAWNSEATAQVYGCRFRVARACIHAMRGVAGADLRITASFEANDPRRHELMGLVAALCDELAVARVSVSVDFERPTVQSAVRLRVSEPTEGAVGAVG